MTDKVNETERWDIIDDNDIMFSNGERNVRVPHQYIDAIYKDGDDIAFQMDTNDIVRIPYRLGIWKQLRGKWMYLITEAPENEDEDE